MSAPACVGEPLSWLLLERHALGELSQSDSARVRAHLAGCAACAACAAETARPLPALARTAEVEAPRALWWRRYAAAWATTAALACAAAGFLLLARPPGRTADVVASGDTLPGVKGGDVALELVRERAGVVTHGADTFAPEDRWKALVTCPAGGVVFWDVTVRDGGRRDERFPLAPAGPLSCGNHVVLPGAFRLSGPGTAEVCVRLAADPVPRDSSARKNLPGRRDICASLRPEL